MWRISALLLILCYLPGAVLYRVPWMARDRRAALPADERLFWAVLLSAASSCAAALVLATLGRYRLGLVVTANLIVTAGLAVAARFDLRLRGAPRPGLDAIVPLALVLAGLWLYFPASEYIMGGKDPGTYMNEGVQIAQRGAFVVRDEVIAAVPRQFRDLFFPSHANPAYYGLRFMGFFIQDPDAGTVIGQFPHLYPASIALGYGVAGLTGARNMVAIWTIGGLLSWYFLGARLFGRTVAALGALLLAINVVTVWFARYPNAEAVMLALLGAALLGAARSLADGDRFFGGISGALLGLLMFLRFDAVLAVAAVVAGILVARFDRKRMGAGFWVVLLPLLALSGLYLAGPMRAYFAYPVVFTRNLRVTAIVAALVVLAAAYVVALRLTRLRAMARACIPALYVVALVALAAYAWFLRQPAGRTALHDAMAFRTFAWYMTAPGLVAAVVGMAVTARRLFWRDPTFFTTSAVFAAFFFYKMRIVPQHFWMTRRFLPVILPAALLFAAAAALYVFDRDGLLRLVRRRQRPGGTRLGDPASPRAAVLTRLLTCLAVAPLAWTFWSANGPVRGHVEYAGLIPRLERLASQFDPSDLVIVESRSASDAHVLALPLAYIYARHVLVLNTPRPDKIAFAAFLDWARERYREVFFLGGGGTDLLSSRIGVEAVAGERFQVPEYDSPTNAYPAGVRRKEFDYSISRFTDSPASAGPFVLDVGTNDDLLVVRFHAKERQPSGLTFRWSRDVSYISIPALRPGATTLTIWMADGGRPPRAGPATVTVVLDDREIGQATPSREIEPFSFRLPEEVVAAAAAREEPARLRLSTTTWKPRALLGVADDRDLGVMVDRVEVR